MPGNVLLFRVLRQSTIGAERLDYRVRNGIGYYTFAIITRHVSVLKIIDNVKFKRKVIPGDTVVFELKLLSPIRRGLVHMGGKGYVNGEVCIEAEMLAHVAKDRTEV